MRRLHPRLVLSTLLLLAGIGVVSFFLVRILTDNSSGEVARGQTNATPAPFPLERILAEDAQKPRFVGDMEGIFITQSEQAVPAEYRAPSCASQAQVQVPWDQAGQLVLDVQLPPQFVFEPEDMNTGVIACEGPGAYVARWAYKLPQGQFVDYPGTLVVARSLSSWFYEDASTDRVKVIDAGGRKAVLVESIRSEGMGDLGPHGTQAHVAFPENFGMTHIFSSGVPLKDLLQVAETVGRATKN